ncbi:MAG: hypothetical protein ACJ788_16145 [Ktedonobacteraceae bacterium]
MANNVTRDTDLDAVLDSSITVLEENLGKGFYFASGIIEDVLEALAESSQLQPDQQVQLRHLIELWDAAPKD